MTSFRILNEIREAVRLAAAEGNNTPLFSALQKLEEGLRHLLVAAQWGADAHSFVHDNLRQAEKLLGIEYK